MDPSPAQQWRTHVDETLSWLGSGLEEIISTLRSGNLFSEPPPSQRNHAQVTRTTAE
ncbi:hypothetical protein XENOCAPTIV_030914, partial [Xenoophorus captivus]